MVSPREINNFLQIVPDYRKEHPSLEDRLNSYGVVFLAERPDFKSFCAEAAEKL
ncbi:hypothetical protein Z945_3371 [Sulfitobacter noctilucae]|nr:hypothetical protein Z945_3371 [Sulfitobacter noctilucae]